MTVAFQVGDRVRIATGALTGCKPGDTGTVTLVTLVSGGDAYYHVRMDPPCRAGTVICYGAEIEPADPN
jgi:hypothetical protein